VASGRGLASARLAAQPLGGIVALLVGWKAAGKPQPMRLLSYAGGLDLT
jgi:hypothetical protein